MAKKEPKKLKPISAFTLFSKSYNLVAKNLGIFILIGGLGLVAQFIASMQIVVSENAQELPKVSSNGAAIFAVAVVVAIVLYTMSVKLQLIVTQNKKPTFMELWEFARSFTFRMLGLGIVVSLVIFAGLLAFIVPGIIFIRRYTLSPYVMADRKTGIFESMKISADLTKPFSSAIWSVIGVSVLISMFSILGPTGSLISAILALLYSIAPALRYEELKKLT